MVEHGLKKRERLNKDLEISPLFSKGKRLFAYPILLFYQQTDCAGEVAILCSVAKKRFHHAVDRNRVKRLIRESFRLNRPQLDTVLKEKKIGVNLAFVMAHDRLPDFESMNGAIGKLLHDVTKNLQDEQ